MFAGDCQTIPADILQRLLEGPGMRPPQNVVPNFENPPNDDNLSYSVTGICLLLSTMFVLARTHAMWIVIKTPGIMDYLMFIAYGLLVAYCIVIFVAINYWGSFVHQWNFKFGDLAPFLHIYLVGTNLFTAQIMLIKTNILMEWLRIFCPRGHRGYIFWTSHAISGINIIWQVASIFLLNFTCRPHAKNWDCTVPGACFDSSSFYITSASFSLFIDIVILILPQKFIWSLNMSLQKKIGVASIFAVGIIAIVAAAFRVEATVRYTQTHDVTFVTSQLTLWTLAEATSGIIVFCMPVLPKVAQAIKESRPFSSLSFRDRSIYWTKESASDSYSESWGQQRRWEEKPRLPVPSSSFSLPIQNFSMTEQDLDDLAAAMPAKATPMRRW